MLYNDSFYLKIVTVILRFFFGNFSGRLYSCITHNPIFKIISVLNVLSDTFVMQIPPPDPVQYSVGGGSIRQKNLREGVKTSHQA
jgi:hypothetical protein